MKKSLAKWHIHAVSALSVLFVLFSVGAAGFIKIAREVSERETKGFDESILKALHAIASPVLDTLVVATTDLGGWMVIIWGGLIFTWLVMKKKWYKAIIIGAGLGGAEVLNLILKALFARPRPELWERLIVEQSFSFPSGHAMASSALAFTVILILWRTKWRIPGLIGMLSFMVYIGFTRLYLGVHYPTDIVAGWLVSGAWVSLVGFVVAYYARHANTVTQSHSHDS